MPMRSKTCNNVSNYILNKSTELLCVSFGALFLDRQFRVLRDIKIADRMSMVHTS